MSLITLVLTIVCVGFVVWLVLQLGLPEPFPRILIAVVVFVLILWILQSFGLIPHVVRLR